MGILVSFNGKSDIRRLFLILLFIVAPIIDNLTGLLISLDVIVVNTAGSPSQFFRFGMLFYSIYLIRYKFQYLLIIILLSAYLISLELLWSFGHLNLSFLSSGIVYSLKIVFLVAVILVLRDILSSNDISLDYVGNLYFYSILLHSTLIIIPKILGIGLSTYGDETFGSKGFFPSNNGLGLFCGIGGLFTTYWASRNHHKYRLITFVLISIGTALIGSKTALLFVVLNMGYYYFTLKRGMTKWCVPILLMLIVVLFFSEISQTFLVVFDVIAFRYRHSTDFSQFFFSSRDDYASMAFSHCNFDGILNFRLLFGAGSFMSFRNPSDTLFAFRTLESDFLDIFFFYGILGLIGYFVFFVNVIVISIKHKVNKVLLLLWILLFAHSLLAGHILFNGMSILVVFTLWFVINKEISMSNKALKR